MARVLSAGSLNHTEALHDLWDDAHAASMSAEQLLLYRSNLLGSDKRITNYGGGNTSAKLSMPDPLTGQPTQVLWVKGSGGDLGSMGLNGFATLYLDKLLALRARYRGRQHEDEMVGLLAHCTFNLNPRAASIDTPLHAFIPHAHVDHMHPDAVIAIAACQHSRELTAQVFGAEIGWLPWQRPGFDLGMRLGAVASEQPQLRGIVLAGHGLFTWGESARECYRTTLGMIQKAHDWLAAHERRPAFGGPVCAPLSPEQRMTVLSALMPVLRGKLSRPELKVGHVDFSPAVLEFVCSARLRELAQAGTSCPDHFLRTKIRPLVLPFDPGEPDPERLLAALPAALEAYRADYRAYYERCRHPDSPAMRDPNPVVYLVPGVGMLTFARDKATARIACEFYINAINVMRGSTGVDCYVGLAEQEAFDIEYWLLEEAKLQRLPKPRSLHGRIALVTGAAGGIGRAVSRRLLAEGACVLLTDLDAPALAEACTQLRAEFGRDVVESLQLDVTDEAAVGAALDTAALQFGGLDILISNAGIASAAPYEETSLELWNRNLAVLATGYFLISRAAYRLMLRQGLPASVVFVGSKNALAASANAAAYCTAKAAELHLARCLALEGASHGIRVNVVNPDAVLRGSRIWHGEWRAERAQAYNLKDEQLEEFYRSRSLLKREVLPEDVAEAAYFFASDLSDKSTGNVLNVDAGNAAAFTR
ncbi:MAG TPA: bifunctional rhamnulose-1-phosphate aldolase/short-chain dehydrogenase [Steroidobacteraceae bacterium]|nr:bifunctional rhamnulose-1-phosphate aldolase/short-chain dehydrogenase [Steroidobacteraceae bacterium]